MSIQSIGRKIAVMGDIHGALDCLKDVYSKLEWESLDEIRHSGDLIDRGPDPGGVIDFCIEKGITGVVGNHEGGMLHKYVLQANPPTKPDKIKSYEAIMSKRERVDYLLSLPKIHMDENNNALFVHAGVYPWVPFYRQSEINGGRIVCHIGMVNKQFPGLSRWYDFCPKRKQTEDQMRSNGWVRWYEVYDGDLDIYVGHRVVTDVEIHHCQGKGKIYFLDTGAHWSGKLTAFLIGQNRFVQSNIPR